MSELAVIIPHLNDQPRLRRCLYALEPQIGDDVQVIVVDNGSDQSIMDLPDEFPWARFAVEQTPGAGLARNLGVALTTAPRLAFIDCDCVPGPDWIDHARAVDIEDRIVGGRVDTFHEGHGARSGAQVFEQVFAFDMARYVARQGFCGSGNMVVDRDVFEMVGPFRVNVAEDMEWCHRAGRTGFEIVYDAELVASHPTRQDWAALKRKWRRLAAERFTLDATSALGRAKWVMRAVLTAASVVRDVPRVLLTERLTGWADRMNCLVTLIRLRFLRAFWMGRQALTGQA
ncbi:MAG: glycosyltransferase family A protein [Pseudomonadota bacterium]